MVQKRRPFSFNFIIGNRKKSQGANRGVRWVVNDSHFVFCHKLLCDDGSLRRGVVMVKQPGLFSSKFGATSSHVFTQSPQNAVEPRIHSLVVSPTYRSHLLPGIIPGTHFCYRPSQPQGHSAAGRIMYMKNSSDTIGNRTRELPVCSTVPQTTAPTLTSLAYIPLLQ
jgi:hypothetical protein